MIQLLFLKNAQDMEEAVTSFEQFGQVAGTPLNIRKSEGLWIGSRKDRQNTCNLYNLKWPTELIKYLGIRLGHDYCSVAMPCSESDSLFMCICEPVYVYRFTGDTPDVVVVNKVAKEPMVG